MADDGRAAQALEDADLDLLRAQRDEPVEAAAEALQIFARQADDEIGVDVDAGVLAEKAQVVLEANEVLSAADILRGGVVEGLDTDFELKRAGRKLGDDFA